MDAIQSGMMRAAVGMSVAKSAMDTTSQNVAKLMESAPTVNQGGGGNQSAQAAVSQNIAANNKGMYDAMGQMATKMPAAQIAGAALSKVV